MVNKRIGLVVVFALVAAGAFAQIQTSAGGGLLFDWNKSSMDFGSGMGADYKNNTIFGVFGFFDATYAEANMAFVLGKVLIPTSWMGDVVLGSAWQLNFTLLGKYPFELGRVTLFPLAGFSYNMVLSLAGSGNNQPAYHVSAPKDLNQFGFLGGVGLDFLFGEHLFIRGEAMIQLRLASQFQKDFADKMAAEQGWKKEDVFPGVGGVFKVGVGYRF